MGRPDPGTALATRSRRFEADRRTGAATISMKRSPAPDRTRPDRTRSASRLSVVHLPAGRRSCSGARRIKRWTSLRRCPNHLAV